MVNGEWYSPLASLRYRVLSPARYLKSRGHVNQFVRVDQIKDEATAQSLRADVVVVSKVFAQRTLEVARQAKSWQARLVVDLCDDHFDTPELGPVYRSLCRLADRVIASTGAMARVIELQTGVRATVIDDPFEGHAGICRFDPQSDAGKLLWFGHPVNFDTLSDMVPSLARLSRTKSLALHVVSDGTHSGIRRYVEQVSRSFGASLTARFTAWSPQATWQALAECDLVVVPSLPSAKKAVKSPNRVVEPLRAGRFVVAYPLPSYVELGEFVCLDENIAAGVEWALAHRGEVLKRVKAGQAYVTRRFHPTSLGRTWEAVLLQIADCAHEAA